MDIDGRPTTTLDYKIAFDDECKGMFHSPETEIRYLRMRLEQVKRSRRIYMGALIGGITGFIIALMFDLYRNGYFGSN